MTCVKRKYDVQIFFKLSCQDTFRKDIHIHTYSKYKVYPVFGVTGRDISASENILAIYEKPMKNIALQCEVRIYEFIKIFLEKSCENIFSKYILMTIYSKINRKICSLNY